MSKRPGLSSFPLCKVLGNKKLGTDRSGRRSLLYPLLNKETMSKYKVAAGSLPLLSCREKKKSLMWKGSGYFVYYKLHCKIMCNKQDRAGNEQDLMERTCG